MLNYVPKYFTNRAIALYFIALAAVSLMFIRHVMPLQFMLFGVVAVVGFFYFSNILTVRWREVSGKTYIKNIFLTALVTRAVYVVFMYHYYIITTGYAFESGFADSGHYHWVAWYLSTIAGFANVWEALTDRWVISDTGYVLILTYFYKIFWWGDGFIPYHGAFVILLVRLMQALVSAYMCVLIYKLAKRNFGEGIARIAGIFAMLMPHFFYYSGVHLKETIMIFLTVFFVERTDHLLRSKKYNFINVVVPVVLAGSLFTFRNILGATALIAFLTAIVFTPSKIVGWGKRILVGVWVVAVIIFFIGGRIAAEVEGFWELRDTAQQASMEHRAVRGNEFARYGTIAIFAPMIFVAPFPTLVDTDQDNIKIMNGSNFVKNITSFFTMLGIFLLFYRKKWRDHVLIISFLCGYLAVVAMSPFAISERYHLPSLPFALIMASYGISQMKNQWKKYFNWWTMFIFVVLIGWSWFKLAGRGML